MHVKGPVLNISKSGGGMAMAPAPLIFYKMDLEALNGIFMMNFILFLWFFRYKYIFSLHWISSESLTFWYQHKRIQENYLFQIPLSICFIWCKSIRTWEMYFLVLFQFGIKCYLFLNLNSLPPHIVNDSSLKCIFSAIGKS